MRENGHIDIQIYSMVKICVKCCTVLEIAGDLHEKPITVCWIITREVIGSY